MHRTTLIALSLAAAVVPLASAAQIEPPRGSALRRELLDAVRPYAAEFVGPPVEFVVDTLLVSDGVALAELEIQRPGGEKIPPWSPIDYAYIAALLRRDTRGWSVVHYVVSPNEPYFCEFAGTEFRPVVPRRCGR
jgi:hypothetical protein